MAYGDYRGPDKPNKGQENGACNRSACQCEPAIWYNHGSLKWYCEECKIALDRANRQGWDALNTGHPMFETRAMLDARTKNFPNLSPIEKGVKTGEYQQFAGRSSHNPQSETRAALQRVLVAGGVQMSDIPDEHEQASMTDPKVIERMQGVIDHLGGSRYDVLNDFTIGNLVRMLGRNDLMHESIVTAARDRIWKLAFELRDAHQRIAELERQLGAETKVVDAQP